MTRKQAIKVVKVLTNLSKTTKFPRHLDKYRGICAVVYNTDPTPFLPRELRPLWMDWKHFSGQISFPIPGGVSTYEERCQKGLSPWTGKQGKYRRSLCRHLVKKLKQKYKIK